MQTYSPGRKGRRKIVNQFTVREGLLIVALITGALVGLMALWILGYVHFDAH